MSKPLESKGKRKASSYDIEDNVTVKAKRGPKPGSVVSPAKLDRMRQEIACMTPRQKMIELLALHEEKTRRESRRAWFRLFPPAHTCISPRSLIPPGYRKTKEGLIVPENITNHITYHDPHTGKWCDPSTPGVVTRVWTPDDKAQKELESFRQEKTGGENPCRCIQCYPKHERFFAQTATFREVGFVAANRVGKTTAGGFATVCHATGRYPNWWQGKRYAKPTRIWVAGKTTATTRDIIQTLLVGPADRENDWGTGLIPGDDIISYTKMRGIPNALESIVIKHASGGKSVIGFKSYEMGRGKFEGTSRHFVWLDEEPPQDVYSECLMRTMDCDGGIVLTFTPLEGLSDVVLSYLPGGKLPSEKDKQTGKYVVFADWNDVPHLTEKAKEELLASIPEHEKEARSKGIPSLGAGAIYSVPEESIKVEPFMIPDHWPRVYALDVGWNRTAALWGALDRESDVVYLYSEHYEGKAQPLVHAAAIKARGEWIPGVIDPAARGRGQADGEKLFDMYEDQGLHLTPAKNSKEAGVYEVWCRLSTGRMKVFSSLRNWFDEFRIYRRDTDGKIVDENNHLMDCTKYLTLSGLDVAKMKPSILRTKLHNLVLLKGRGKPGAMAA